MGWNGNTREVKEGREKEKKKRTGREAMQREHMRDNEGREKEKKGRS